MKNLILTLAMLIAMPNFVSAADAIKIPVYPVHLLPDESAPAADVVQILQNSESSLFSSYVTEAIKAGKKNLDWLKQMNSVRPDDNKIALTKPGELKSYPIDQPSIYSPATIQKTFEEISSEIPANMKDIIFGNASFSNDPGLDLETYIVWAKKVDRMYQTAVRWTLMEPNLFWYGNNKQNDIRGYYYLAKEENLSQKLQSFSSLANEDQARLSPYLINLCENTKGVGNGCDNLLKSSIKSNSVKKFYETYFPRAKSLYDNYFEIQGTRSEITTDLNSSPQVTTVPIRFTQSDVVNKFLSYNIEDEWKWNNWQLKLNFTPNAAVHVNFEPGQTPHVNGIAGDTITMDDNTPLTEWDVQWTIRHEFGHVLGFPDCYVEFYDSSIKAMVNYQIDVANMMCSRAGRMQEVHYSEMKKNYFN